MLCCNQIFYTTLSDLNFSLGFRITECYTQHLLLCNCCWEKSLHVRTNSWLDSVGDDRGFKLYWRSLRQCVLRFWHEAEAVPRVQRLVKWDLSIWAWHLQADSPSGCGFFKSYSQRSGRGYAGVLAEFKLSKQSCVWTSLCVNWTECVFVGIGETKTELQYLFSWSLHLLSCFFELEFEDKTRCAFEGSWSLCIYVKCTCALTFPHYGGIHYARIMCPPFS